MLNNLSQLWYWAGGLPAASKLTWAVFCLGWMALAVITLTALDSWLRERRRAKQEALRRLQAVAAGYGSSWGSLGRPKAEPVLRPGAIIVVNDAGKFKEASGQPGEVPVGVCVHSCPQLRPDEAYLIKPEQPIFNAVLFDTPPQEKMDFTAMYDMMVDYPRYTSVIRITDL